MYPHEPPEYQCPLCAIIAGWNTAKRPCGDSPNSRSLSVAPPTECRFPVAVFPQHLRTSTALPRIGCPSVWGQSAFGRLSQTGASLRESPPDSTTSRLAPRSLALPPAHRSSLHRRQLLHQASGSHATRTPHRVRQSHQRQCYLRVRLTLRSWGRSPGKPWPAHWPVSSSVARAKAAFPRRPPLSSNVWAHRQLRCYCGVALNAEATVDPKLHQSPTSPASCRRARSATWSRPVVACPARGVNA